MGNPARPPEQAGREQPEGMLRDGLVTRPAPLPTTQFRQRAWRQFQRAIDPLAPPKPLRPPKR